MTQYLHLRLPEPLKDRCERARCSRRWAATFTAAFCKFDSRWSTRASGLACLCGRRVHLDIGTLGEGNPTYADAIHDTASSTTHTALISPAIDSAEPARSSQKKGL